MRFEDLLINTAYLLKWCAFLAGIGLTVLTFLGRTRWIRREFFPPFLPASIRFGVAPGVPIPDRRRRMKIQLLLAGLLFLISRGGDAAANRMREAWLVAIDTGHVLTRLVEVTGDVESFRDLDNTVTVELVDTLMRTHRKLAVPMLLPPSDSAMSAIIHCVAERYGQAVGVDSFPARWGSVVVLSGETVTILPGVAKVTIYVDSVASLSSVTCRPSNAVLDTKNLMNDVVQDANGKAWSDPLRTPK